MPDARAAIARIVADHWRAAAMRWGAAPWRARDTAHPLCLVIAALDGETDPAMLGVCEGPDADAIRALTGGDGGRGDHSFLCATRQTAGSPLCNCGSKGRR